MSGPAKAETTAERHTGRVVKSDVHVFGRSSAARLRSRVFSLDNQLTWRSAIRAVFANLRRQHQRMKLRRVSFRKR
jgi:hypothetical protein